MKLWCYLGFCSEIRTVSLILGLGSSLVSRFHSLLSSLDPDPVKSFTSSSFFFSDPMLAITLAARYLRWRARVWIASSAIRWWRFLWISENCLQLYKFCVNSASIWFCALNSVGNLKFYREIALNWCWIWARVCVCSWAFCEFCWVWSVTAKREKILLCLWCGV